LGETRERIKGVILEKTILRRYGWIAVIGAKELEKGGL
jgi:hypothetical protein